VFHLHFHVIPVYAGENVGPHASGSKADDAQLAALAQEIAARIA
jgi:histidine triad (HIT) family protein